MSGDSREEALFERGLGPGLSGTLSCIHSLQRHSASMCSDDSSLGPKELQCRVWGHFPSDQGVLGGQG